MSGADWGNGGSYDPSQYGLLSGGYTSPSGGGLLSAFAPGALYPQGLFTPQQQQAMAGNGLLAMAGAFGQGAMPSRLPVPIGAVLGQAAGAYGQSQNQAAEEAMKGTSLGLQQQQMRFKINAAQQLMQALANGGGGLLAQPGQGMPGMVPTAPNPGGLLAQPSAGTATGNGLPPTMTGAPTGSGNGMLTTGMTPPSSLAPQPDNVLPLIRHYESGDNPNVGYGGVDLSKAPLDSTGFPIWEGNQGPEGPSHAAGFYQIQPELWHKYAPMAGVKDFSPASQDAVARLIYADQGLKPWASNTRLMSAVGGVGTPAGGTNATGSVATLPGGMASGLPPAPSYDYGRAMQLGLLGDIAGFPSVGQMVTQSPGYQGAVAAAKAGATLPYNEAQKRYETNLQILSAGPIAGAQAAAKFPYENAINQLKPQILRPGAAVRDPATGQMTYTPSLVQVTKPDGSKEYVYMSPNSVTPTGQSAGISPQASSYQKTTGANVANYGGYLNPPPGQAGVPPASPTAPTAAPSAPAGNTAPSTGLVTGGAVPGAVPGTNPYGAYSSQPPSKAALAQPAPLVPVGQGSMATANVPTTGAIDPLKFRTQPIKTDAGTLVPPLSAESRPTDPAAVKVALPDWQKANSEIVDGIEPSLQAKQRLVTFSQMLQDFQSGSFMSHRAQWANDLRGLGLGTLANVIMSAKDSADVLTAIHENYLSTLSTLKSSTNRFTNNEFTTISDRNVSPDLPPDTNRQILTENIAFLDRNIQLAQDWNTASKYGWKNPLSFETEWNRINPMPESLARASGTVGQPRGALPTSGGAAPVTNARPTASASPAAGRPTVAPEGQVMQGPGGHLIIKQNGGWVDAVTKQPLGFGKIPSR